MNLRKRRNRVAAPLVRRWAVIEPLEDRVLLNAADLDSTFGVNGVASTQFTGFGQSVAEGVAVQSDGKSVVAGFAYAGGVGEKIALARYNTNGTLDTTFGTGGKDLISAGNYGQANAVAIQPDGKIVFAGESSSDNSSTYQFMVGRVNTNGTLDTTFNSTGIEIFNGQNGEVATCVAIQSNGNIVLGGLINRGASEMVLARVSSTGVPDTTFGAGGISAISYTNSSASADSVNSLAFDSSGNLYGGVIVGTTSSSVIGVARFTSTGALNLSFGNAGGIAKTSVRGVFGQRDAIAIQSNGEIDLAGGYGSFSAARVTSSGAFDGSFGTNGVFTYIGNNDSCTAVGVLSSGDLVLAGYSTSSNIFGDQPMELRLKSTGVLDTTFNGTGVSIVSGTPMTVNAAVVQSTGVVTLAGNSPTVQDVMAGQINATGGADGTFNVTGFTSLDLPITVAGVGKTALLQSDGKLIVAGTYNQGVGYARGTQGVVNRYNTNGTLDTTFGTNGYAYINVGGTFSVAAAVLQSNGDIVVEGTAIDPGHTTSYVAVERLLPTGAVDTSFGVGGIYLLNTTRGYDTFTNAAALLRLSDDSLLVVTNSSNGGQITKLSATLGSPVTSYGTLGTGIVKDPNNQWTSGTIDSTGLPVLSDGSLERYTAAGTLDTTFANGVSALSGGIGNASMAIDSSGGIISSSFQGSTLHRNLTTGSTDFSFDGVPAVQNVTVGAVAALPNGDIVTAGKQSGVGMECLAFDAAGQPIQAFGASGAEGYAAGTATDAIAVTTGGKIILVGQSNGAEIVIQLNGQLPAVLPGDHQNTNTFTLALSADGQTINWTATSSAVTRTGSLAAADPAGILINGNTAGDSINLSFTNGDPLPRLLQLNGSYTINGLSGTNPLANRTIDIGANTLFISYGSPAADPLTTLRGYLKNGYNAGAWTGAPTSTTGVITSANAAANSSKTTGIGYADSAEGLVSLPANTIELKYTLYGDTGLTGSVGFADFMRMTQHYTLTGMTWAKGDFNYDGTVDGNDFNLLQPNYGQTLPAPAPIPAPAPVMTPIVVAPVSAPANPPGGSDDPSKKVPVVVVVAKSKPKPKADKSHGKRR